MDLDKLQLSDKIIAGTGIVLIIDLLFLPWHRIDFGFASASRSALESPNGFWGILALLLTLVVVGVTLLRALKPEQELPDLPVSWFQATFFATIAVEAVLLLKLVIETDFLGFGSYLAILLAGGMVYGGFLKNKEGVEGATTP